MPVPVEDPLVGRAMTDDEVAQLVGASFGQLSLEERDKALSDLNGVPDSIDETPELLERYFKELARELEAIRSKAAYEIALHQSPSLANLRSFQLRFLRAERFDIQKAAQRIVRHFETKRELFAEETLGREIQPSDLSEEDLQAFRTGYVRLLPLRDQAGRLIVFYAKSIFPWSMSLQTRVSL